MEEIEQAAEAIAEADALLVGAGAGMGVDSGLPDFRGKHGFWREYPPFQNMGFDFYAMANPKRFDEDPELAWGFYGHRLNLYRDTDPHAGFDILRRLGRQMKHGAFVFTSNVDGQFQQAGFDEERILECHGSIHHLQCLRGCGRRIWPADGAEVNVDDETFRARRPLPTCPSCGDVARPNVLMFGDLQWLSERSAEQERRFGEWLQRLADAKLVVVECGAGTAVPTVRRQCERVSRKLDGELIRINPRESHGPAGTIAVARPALAALREIDERVP